MEETSGEEGHDDPLLLTRDARSPSLDAILGEIDSTLLTTTGSQLSAGGGNELHLDLSLSGLLKGTDDDFDDIFGDGGGSTTTVPTAAALAPSSSTGNTGGATTAVEGTSTTTTTTTSTTTTGTIPSTVHVTDTIASGHKSTTPPVPIANTGLGEDDRE